MSTNDSVRGAGTDRPGATDTTMLVWKVIHANPGITRQEIFARIEHQIPSGWALRRYTKQAWFRRRKTSCPPAGGQEVFLRRARGFILSYMLNQMCHKGSITTDGDGYRTIRQPHYKGNPEHVDETGAKAAEHVNTAYALKTAETFAKRARQAMAANPKARPQPTVKELSAILRIIETYRTR